MAWLLWVAAAVVLGILEVVSVSLVLVMFAGGSLAAALVSLFNVPWWGQFITAAVVSVILLVFLRPWLLRQMRKRGPVEETNVSALVGHEAIVVSEVGSDYGRVKLSGEVWSARSASGAVVAVGARVKVTAIDGATAVVQAQDAPAV